MHASKHENVLKIDTMNWMGMVKHFQSSQNSKFAMSLQSLKNEVRDEVDFLHADKQSDLQVHFNTLGTKFSEKVILSLLMNISSIIEVLKVTSVQIFAISQKRSQKWC